MQSKEEVQRATTKQGLKDAVCAAIDARRDEIIGLGQRILANPELGFKEVETARLAAETLRQMGLPPREHLAITGVKAVARGSHPGPTVAVLGEMDALINYEHPSADATAGAAHCCGHQAQGASMLGTAIGLLHSEAMEHLAGSVAFMAVPAEEFIEIDYRLSLRKRGQIEFLGGKQELIRLGEFDVVALYPEAERQTKVSQILRIPDSVEPFCLVPIGYPAETKPPRTRFDAEKVHHDFF